MDVPLGYSRDDLIMLRSAAARDYPAMVGVIDEYLNLTERSTTEISHDVSAKTTPGRRTSTNVGETHLFDLLRSKKLFPSNSDLAEFAGKILPGIKGNRFDKMSRGDIAARVIEHLETKDVRTREE